MNPLQNFALCGGCADEPLTLREAPNRAGTNRIIMTGGGKDGRRRVAAHPSGVPTARVGEVYGMKEMP